MATYQAVEREYLVSEKIDETPEVLIVGMKPGDGKPTQFDPGMFMMLFGIDKVTGEKHAGRAFSIASDPSSPSVEFFVIKNPTHGEHIGRSHFVDIEVGDPFTLRGPSGQFKFDPDKDAKVLFIAGGTGVAPFMSMLRHIQVRGAKTDVSMIYSVKYPTEIIRRGELDNFVRGRGIKLAVSVTRPAEGDGWTGQTGHVDSTMVQRHVPDFSERMCYICGPLAFVKAAKEALAALNIPPQRISADVWG